MNLQPTGLQRPARALALFTIALFAAAAPVPAQIAARKSTPRLHVSYEPTSMPVVNAMLELARVRVDDFLIDLGCGDGRIPITAAKQLGATALGVDLDPARIHEARSNAAKERVEDKVTFREEDLFKTDIADATVLTLFLFPSLNLKLRPRLLELPPGTRVVSHEYDMGNWRPDRTLSIAGGHLIHLWIVPAKISGLWHGTMDGRTVELSFEQRHQRFQGWLSEGRKNSFRGGRIDGSNIQFKVRFDGMTRDVVGVLAPSGRMAGEGWEAHRKM